MITIKHTCPEISLPAKTPTCRLVTTLLEGHTSRLPQFRGGIRRNLIRWIQAIKMGDVTMLVTRVIKIFTPLLQLSVLAHLHRWNHWDGSHQFLLKISVFIQHLSCCQCLCKYIAYNLVIHCTCSTNRGLLADTAMFRRSAGHNE